MALLHVFTVFPLILSSICFLPSNFYAFEFNTTVSLDSSGDYKTIGEAITAAPDDSSSRYYIHVKPGTYYERIEVPSHKTYLTLIGDSASTTVIVFNRSNAAGFSTTDSATFHVKAANFMAQSITFQNSAGPQNGQAVAILDEGRETTYYKCRFLGFQDTLYTKGIKQFFKECEIYGTVDFIFGNGLVVFQDCMIYAQLPRSSITVTAQSKEKNDGSSGFSFQNCTVTVSPTIASNKSDVRVFLGRPWRNYSMVIFMETFLDDVVDPTGWMEWEGVPVDLLFYAEFDNRGPGADVSKRVKWPGYHVLDKKLARDFTVENFINGTEWLPETGVPFRTGLF